MELLRQFGLRPTEVFWEIPYRQLILMLNGISPRVATSEEFVTFLAPFMEGGGKIG